MNIQHCIKWKLSFWISVKNKIFNQSYCTVHRVHRVQYIEYSTYRVLVSEQKRNSFFVTLLIAVYLYLNWRNMYSFIYEFLQTEMFNFRTKVHVHWTVFPLSLKVFESIHYFGNEQSSIYLAHFIEKIGR